MAAECPLCGGSHPNSPCPILSMPPLTSEQARIFYEITRTYPTDVGIEVLSDQCKTSS